MSCTCFIIPPDVLKRLASDRNLSDKTRAAARNTATISTQMRRLREQALAVTVAASAAARPTRALAKAPEITVYDCKHHQTLPGALVAKPGTAKDPTAKRTFKETTAVAEFYRTVFKRNSVDDAGMTLLSSVHYGVDYDNAMWNGTQMVYGDGDNALFVDFTLGNDVIGHELTHGVTQHSLQLGYSGDAGGLNESLSDCFGSMFRQWQAKQDSASADWLIGSDILGPDAKKKGYNCLRNMADPADKRCIAPQPVKYSQITKGMDPHYSSGPPNLAFCLACNGAGGKSWETVGQVWYRAMTGFGPSPRMTMKAFAKRT
ncbi:MAG TPA: M4 family metallopeptidase, partial [Rudaea sp.]|nr:M4 family metallopeptidase [Rudaea sp.]